MSDKITYQVAVVNEQWEASSLASKLTGQYVRERRRLIAEGRESEALTKPEISLKVLEEVRKVFPSYGVQTTVKHFTTDDREVKKPSPE